MFPGLRTDLLAHSPTSSSAAVRPSKFPLASFRHLLLRLSCPHVLRQHVFLTSPPSSFSFVITSTTSMGLCCVPWLTLLLWWKKTCPLALLLCLHNCLVLLQLVKESLDLFSPLLNLSILLSPLQEIASSFVFTKRLLGFRPLTGLLILLSGLQEKTCLLFRLDWILKKHLPRLAASTTSIFSYSLKALKPKI